MAKKKEESLTPDEITNSVVAAIEKAHGEGVLMDASSLKTEKESIANISTSIDIISSGGIKKGTWLGLTGPKKCGKSIFGLSVGKELQRPEHGNCTIWYAKVEGRLSEKHLNIPGLITTPDRFRIIGSSKDKKMSAEDYIFCFEQILQIPNVVLIIDCISSLVEEKVLKEARVGSSTRGGAAKLFTQFLDRNCDVVPNNGAVVVGITRQIANTGGHPNGPETVEKCAKAWQYQCDYAFETYSTGKNWYKDESKTVNQGIITRWYCKSSDLGPPGLTMESYFRFGAGYDAIYEAVLLGDVTKVITQKGAWYSLDWADGVKAQGIEKMCTLLRNEPELACEVIRRVKMACGVQERFC